MRKLAALSFVLAAILGDASHADADFAARLAEADRLAWLTNWHAALPLYAEVEREAARAGSRREAMHAKFGRLRGLMETLPLPDISEEIAVDLASELARGDRLLRLHGLTIKGDVDLEWNVLAAERAWREVRHLAQELGDQGWENRANGELGIIGFLKGNTGEATRLVQQALKVATESGDVGGQLRYLGTIANGLVLAGYAPLAMTYVDRALAFADAHPEAGFPYVVYSTKVLTLLALKQPNEAERVANAALGEARAAGRRIKEIELLMLLARLENERGRPDEATAYVKQAIETARAGGVQRLLADAESVLADTYRARGDLGQARRHASTAVTETRSAGTLFTLPGRLRILAEILAAQGRVSEAILAYEEADDVIEAIMVNVPSREAQARLVAARSNVYEGHFRLVAERLRDPARAYDVIEKARGRAAADVLRTLPDDQAATSDAAGTAAATISRLQVRLMRARSPSERQRLLDELWEAEQRSKLQGAQPSARVAIGDRRVPIRSLQRHLAAGEVILEYVLIEPHSYCLFISRGGLHLVRLPSKTRIEALVDRFVADLRTAPGRHAVSAGDLHAAVLQPVAGWHTAKRLFIVPDGKLHILPFDALLNLNAAEDRAVSTVPSANALFLLRTRVERVEADRPLFAIGGVPYDRMFGAKSPGTGATRSVDTRGLLDATFPSDLPVLASARAEVLAAARLLGPGSVVLTGEEATESALKAQDLGSFGILHFAAHAFADPKFPDRAAVVLLDDPVSGDDGLLQPREIGLLRLNAGLVVLSACDTAVGPTLGQEGVLNLARAFLLAGARSVITTLWPVSDESSAALTRRFYEHLVAGHDVAEALMLGKRAMLAEFGPGALGSVAAFQVVGVGDYRVAASTPRATPAGERHR